MLSPTRVQCPAIPPASHAQTSGRSHSGSVGLGVAEPSPPFMQCSTCCNTGQESLLLTSQHLGDSLHLTWTVAWQQRPLLRSHCRQRFALKGGSFVPNKIHRAEGCTVSDCSKAPGLHHSYHRPITTVAQDLHIIRLMQRHPRTCPQEGGSMHFTQSPEVSASP